MIYYDHANCIVFVCKYLLLTYGALLFFKTRSLFSLYRACHFLLCAQVFHTVRNLHFWSKIQLWLPEKIVDFNGWKTRENVVVLDLVAVDNFDFTRKMVKKILGEKVVKMLGLCQNWIFGQKFDFSIVCIFNLILTEHESGPQIMQWAPIPNSWITTKKFYKLIFLIFPAFRIPWNNAFSISEYLCTRSWPRDENWRVWEDLRSKWWLRPQWYEHRQLFAFR